MQNAVIRTEKTWGVQSVGPRPGESHLQHGAPGLGPPLFCVAHGETGLSLSFQKPLVLLPSTQAAASLGQYGASRSHAYLPTFNGELGPQCHPCLTELRTKNGKSGWAHLPWGCPQVSDFGSLAGRAFRSSSPFCTAESPCCETGWDAGASKLSCFSNCPCSST